MKYVEDLILANVKAESYHSCRVDEAFNVRIADFGLSRDVYESNYYVLRHSARLPVRWMALESLVDGRFNLTTDVVCRICITIFNSVKILHYFVLVKL